MLEEALAGAKTFRGLRRAAGLTLWEAADRSGLSVDRIRRLEEGSEPVPRRRSGQMLLWRLARAYGVPFELMLLAAAVSPPFTPAEPLEPRDIAKEVAGGER
jgi:transcriptional regulator with XRE-family HTH domain